MQVKLNNTNENKLLQMFYYERRKKIQNIILTKKNLSHFKYINWFLMENLKNNLILNKKYFTDNKKTKYYYDLDIKTLNFLR